MRAMRLSLLTFLLNSWLVHSIQSLACVNDYVSSITCVWNSSGIGPGVACHLQGRKATSVRSCTLKPLLESSGTLSSCHLVFELHRFVFLDKIPLNVTCNNATKARNPQYSPALNIKMHPPGSPAIVKSNMSWSRGHPFSDRIFDYKFQMQFKRENQRWEEAQNTSTSGQKMWVDLNEDMLQKGALYQARVRVQPTRELSGVWSDWSPTTSWRSEVGNTPPQGFSWSLDVPVALTFSCTLLIVMVFLCCAYGEKWFYQIKCLHIPDPSKYFANLHSIHGGNFQKWLRPMFSPDSFDILCNSEDISVLEISKEKVTPAYLEFSSLAKQWDGSGHSIYSNLGYLYSKYPSSYEIEPCSVYFSYQPGEGLSRGEECGEDGTFQPPLQTSSSYERLAKLGDFQGHVEVHDSGFGTGQEDQEIEENEEERVQLSGLGEAAHRPAPVMARPSPRAPFVQPSHSFPQPPYTYPIPLDLGLAERPNSPVESFGLTPGRFSSVKLEPSNDGYLSLQDMLLHGGNKSI